MATRFKASWAHLLACGGWMTTRMQTFHAHTPQSPTVPPFIVTTALTYPHVYACSDCTQVAQGDARATSDVAAEGAMRPRRQQTGGAPRINLSDISDSASSTDPPEVRMQKSPLPACVPHACLSRLAWPTVHCPHTLMMFGNTCAWPALAVMAMAIVVAAISHAQRSHAYAPTCTHD